MTHIALYLTLIIYCVIGYLLRSQTKFGIHTSGILIFEVGHVSKNKTCNFFLLVWDFESIRQDKIIFPIKPSKFPIIALMEYELLSWSMLLSTKIEKKKIFYFPTFPLNFHPNTIISRIEFPNLSKLLVKYDAKFKKKLKIAKVFWKFCSKNLHTLYMYKFTIAGQGYKLSTQIQIVSKSSISNTCLNVPIAIGNLQ